MVVLRVSKVIPVANDGRRDADRATDGTTTFPYQHVSQGSGYGDGHSSHGVDGEWRSVIVIARRPTCPTHPLRLAA